MMKNTVTLKNVVLSTILVIMSELVLADTNGVLDVLTDIKFLTKAGQLDEAYQKSLVHKNSDDLIALHYAQLSLLLGKEAQAMNEFSALLAKSSLSTTQKNNIQRFLSQFELSIKSKLRQADNYKFKGECKKAMPLYLTTSLYADTKDKALKGLKECEHPDYRDSFSTDPFAEQIGGYIRYGLGHDSNIDLSNDELENEDAETSSNLRNEGFQRFNLIIKKSIDRNSQFWVQPQYSLYLKDYFTADSGVFDQTSNNLKLKVGGRYDAQVKWQLPLYYQNIRLDNQDYLNYFGIKPTLFLRNGKTRQSFSYLYQQKRYSENQYEDGDANIQDIAYSRSYFIAPYYLMAKMSYRNHDVNLRPSSSFGRFSLDVRLQRKLLELDDLTAWKTALYSRATVSHYQYESADENLESLLGETYSNKRQETRYNLSVGIKSKLNNIQVRSSLMYQYRDSNLPLYEYSRNIFEVDFQYRF